MCFAITFSSRKKRNQSLEKEEEKRAEEAYVDIERNQKPSSPF